MERVYHKWYSPVLGRDMELLVFGHSGVPVIFFPTRSAHFYDFENWKIIDALKTKINGGLLQVYCVDSIDCESFYSKSAPAQRILRHIKYEKYILSEVIPFIKKLNPETRLTVAGCSLGGYHAVNIAFRHPTLFTKVVGMSSRYDLTINLPFFDDLFDGYRDENIYFNMPNHFIPQISEHRILTNLRQMKVILAVGREDSFLNNNEQLSDALNKINVPHELHIWQEEAHRPFYWRQMVQLYL